MQAQINDDKSFVGVSHDNVILLNQWQPVAVTFQNGTLSFYVNGIDAGNHDNVPIPLARSAPIRPGMRATDSKRAFHGSMDDIRIYNRTLSQAEVLSAMQNVAPEPTSTPTSTGEPIEAVHARSSVSPAWLETLERAFSDSTLFEPRLLPQSPEKEPVHCFLEVIEPLIRQGHQRLHEGIKTLVRSGSSESSYSDLPFDPKTVEAILFANLPSNLVAVLSRTMTLELHVARLSGLLEGATPEERFQSFIDHVRQPDVAIELLQEYPVLARQLTIAIERRLTFSLSRSKFQVLRENSG